MPEPPFPGHEETKRLSHRLFTSRPSQPGSFGWQQQGPEDLFSSTLVEDELLRNELQDLKGPKAFLLLMGCEG